MKSATLQMLLLACMLDACGAPFGKSIQSDKLTAAWVGECVGRLQLLFPEKAHVSANAFETVLTNIKIGEAQPASHFFDGQEDGYTEFYVHGHMLISHPIDGSDVDKLIQAQRRERSEARRRHKETPFDRFGNPRKFVPIEEATHRTVGWRINDAHSILTSVGSSVILWSVGSNSPNVEAEIRRQSDFFRTLLRAEPRTFGAVLSR